jgi:RHS repeat-associated protein
LGRTTTLQAAGLGPVSLSYSTNGEIETISSGSGTLLRKTIFGYGPDGNVSSITDPVGRITMFDYDTDGRPTQKVLSDGRVVSYGYDANGNFARIKPPSRPAHSFGHDPINLPKQYTPPAVSQSSESTMLTYNQDRQLTQAIRPNGELVTYHYDPDSARLMSISTPRGIYSYTFDQSSRNLELVTNPEGDTLSYGYDGSVPTETAWNGEVSGLIRFAYDNNFQLKQLEVNDSHAIEFSYDNDGLLTQAGEFLVVRDALSGFLSGTTVQSISDSYMFDPIFGELSGYSADYEGSPKYSATMTRDNLGRITEKVETIQGATSSFAYAYDTAGHLETVFKDGQSFAHYSYDSNSNRVSWTDPWGADSATYDDQDRLLTHGSLALTYDANGDLLSKGIGGATIDYDYDVLGNLQQVVLPSGITIDYVIDPSLRRVGKKVNGVLTQGFLYKDQLNPAAELDGQGNVVSVFVYGTRSNVPDYFTNGGELYRIISDDLGSPRLVIRASDGAIVQRLDYGPFGRVLLDTNPGFQPFGFAGGIYDYQTSLVRFGARDYDPEAGRWTTKDPLLFGGGDTNLYGYALGDPINLYDPAGLAALYCGLSARATPKGPKFTGLGGGEKFFWIDTDFNYGTGYRAAAGVARASKKLKAPGPFAGLALVPTGKDMQGSGFGGGSGVGIGRSDAGWWSIESSPPGAYLDYTETKIQERGNLADDLNRLTQPASDLFNDFADWFGDNSERFADDLADQLLPKDDGCDCE